MSIAAFGFSSLLLLLLRASPFRFSRQAELGDGGPLKTSARLYLYAVQQQEQATITECAGGGSHLSGSECSVCGSTARQVTVQPHFLHLTTQAWGSAGRTPVIARTIIGEYIAKVTTLC